MTWSEDGFLDGKLKIKQPKAGFRAGSDAVLLAAAVDLKAGDTLLDVGCGVGTAALCVKYRIPECKIWGLEVQSELAEAARINAQRNGLDTDLVIFDADIVYRKNFDQLVGPSGRSFLSDGFDHVISNPPFYASGHAQKSPNAIKSIAHVEGEADLAYWINFCAARVKPKGKFTLIHRTDRLSEILREMEKTCGDLHVIPLWPNATTDAKRVIVQGTKSHKGPMKLGTGIVLHEMNGMPTDASEKLLRDGVPLSAMHN
ncbi:MAG: methyltransferase [Sneathiella sp.]|nr:methyltransferase [Sneathiella sp.]